jgi:hypothetical protein
MKPICKKAMESDDPVWEWEACRSACTSKKSQNSHYYYMPFQILKAGKAYAVINSVTGKIHANHTTLKKAKAQIRLLHMLGY